MSRDGARRAGSRIWLEASAFSFLLTGLSIFGANLLHEAGHLVAAALAQRSLHGLALAAGPFGGITAVGHPGPFARIAVTSAGGATAVVGGVALWLSLKRRVPPTIRAFLGLVPAVESLRGGLFILLSAATGSVVAGDLRELAASTPLADWRAAWPLAGAAILLAASAWIWLVLSASLPERETETNPHRLMAAAGIAGGTLGAVGFSHVAALWTEFGALAMRAGPLALVVLGPHLTLCALGGAGWLIGRPMPSGALRRMSIAYLLLMNLGQLGYELERPAVDAARARASSAGGGWSVEEAAARGDRFALMIQQAERAEAEQRWPDAVRLWKRIHELSPTQAYLSVRFGRALYLAGESSEAERILERTLFTGVQNRVDVPRLHHWLGRIALDDGDERAACAHFREQLSHEIVPSRQEPLLEPAEPYIATIPSCTVER